MCLAHSLLALLDSGKFKPCVSMTILLLTSRYTKNTVRSRQLYFVHILDKKIRELASLTNVGPVVRLAPNRYSLDSSEAAKVILGHHNALDKSNFYHPFGRPDEYN